jgi:hypothetical protein
MKITTRKCPACGRKVQYISYEDGTGWMQQHKNQQGELCDEQPKPKENSFAKFLSGIRVKNVK